uniref:Protein kinase domain-containing protein n=2 Tax=Panagrolaimus sp. ES5 TaxID=591445 RepID=A0AC34FTY6_9BILA
MAVVKNQLTQFYPGSKFGQWRIIEKLEEDPEGAHYKVSNKHGIYALKIEKLDVKFSFVIREIEILAALTKYGGRHIRHIEESGQTDDFSFAVLTPVGKSLEDLRNEAPKKRFTIGTAITVGIQCLEALEDLHAIGYLFRDIKPSNFAIGAAEHCEHRRIYVSDFCMAKKFSEYGTPRSIGARFNIDARYAPLACHEKQKMRCIDEVESWFYMLVEWTRGKLPWKNLDIETSGGWKKRCRKTLWYDQLLFGCPWEFLDIWRLIKSAKDPDKPDYQKIYVLLIQAMVKSKKLQYPFDWEVWEQKRMLKEEKKNKKQLESVKDVTKSTWTFDWIWSLPEKRLKAYENLPDMSLGSSVAKVEKEFEYYFKIFPKGVPDTKYAKGSWFFLSVRNLKKKSNIEAKYSISIFSANYYQECQFVFKDYDNWEMHGIRIDELFNPRKRCFVGGEISVILSGKFTKVPKLSQFTAEESLGNEMDYLSLSASKSLDRTGASIYLSLKDVYFPPDDLWLRSKCYLIGITFYENVSKFRKFTKVPKLSQFTAEESLGNEMDYLSVSKSLDQTGASIYLSLKDVYFPPDDLWLRSKCYLIGITFYENVSKFRPSIDDIQKYTIIKPDDVVSVQGDGHCGYRSLSVLICGKQYYHNKIRRMLCSMITQNTDPNFEEMYIFRNAKAIAHGKLQVDSGIDCEERNWMDDADLAAAANLFECNIFVLNSLDQWQCYGKKTFENGIMDSFVNFDPKLPTLLLQNSGGNHFSPVVNVRLK